MVMPNLLRTRFELYSQSSRFERQCDHARALITQALRKMSKPYIAFSSGKDSTVTAALVWEQDPSVPAVYFDADCAYPETEEFLVRMAEDGRTVIAWVGEPLLDIYERGANPMQETVRTPLKKLIVDYGFDGAFLGLRADESPGRRANYRRRGALYTTERDGLLVCTPIARFTYEDVWGFIVGEGLAYNEVYDRMWTLPEEAQRVSYWAGDTNVRYGRFVWLKQHYPSLFNQLAARFPEAMQFI